MLELHNERKEPSNVRKNKRTIKFDKRAISRDVKTTQCENETIKFGIMIT